jgi:predicted dinucleotide-binding enzyme
MIKIGVLGTGMVGTTLASRLVELGHEVRIGSRSPQNETARDWAADAGPRATAGDFTDAASFGDVVINATAGANSLEALGQAGAGALAGKVLLDVSNPLRHEGSETTLTIANDNSLAESIQRAFPAVRVVKALNTMNCQVMVRPELVPGEHVVFMCGEDSAAKDTVAGLLGGFGWPSERIIDLGPIAAARGTEAFMLLWLPLWRALGGGHFNLALARSSQEGSAERAQR